MDRNNAHTKSNVSGSVAGSSCIKYPTTVEYSICVWESDSPIAKNQAVKTVRTRRAGLEARVSVIVSSSYFHKRRVFA